LSGSADYIKKALIAKRESKHVEFKAKFDVALTEDWCEIIKDLVAMANTGGGVIVVGCDNSGQSSGATLAGVLSLDPAHLADKVHKYTETNFSDFEIHELKRGAKPCAAIVIGPAPIPMVFCQAGTYQDPTNQTKQKTAFAKGTVFFRHGAKSEPGTTDDIRQAIERRLEEIRKEWIGGVRKLVAAPAGSQVTVLPAEVFGATSQTGTPIRVTDDPKAPAYRVVDVDATYPFRLKELAAEAKKRLPSDTPFGSYDVQVIRRLHGIDANKTFFHSPKYGSPQYSPAFADWIVDQHKKDPQFFTKNRETLGKKIATQETVDKLPSTGLADLPH
jgi:hypothetical protein